MKNRTRKNKMVLKKIKGGECACMLGQTGGSCVKLPPELKIGGGCGCKTINLLPTPLKGGRKKRKTYRRA